MAVTPAGAVLALGQRACGILDNPGMTLDSASDSFALIMKIPRDNSAAFFRSAARHLCPDQA